MMQACTVMQARTMMWVCIVLWHNSIDKKYRYEKRSGTWNIFLLLLLWQKFFIILECFHTRIHIAQHMYLTYQWTTNANVSMHTMIHAIQYFFAIVILMIIIRLSPVLQYCVCIEAGDATFYILLNKSILNVIQRWKYYFNGGQRSCPCLWSALFWSIEVLFLRPVSIFLFVHIGACGCFYCCSVVFPIIWK